MSFFSSLYGSRGLIVLLAAGGAFLVYENRQLTEALAAARSDILQCKARVLLPPPLMPAGQDGSGMALESIPTPNAPPPLPPNCPPPAPQAAEKAAPSAAVTPQKPEPPILNSLQDAFPPKPPADTPPLSTVSPLGDGGWGTPKP